MYLLNTSQCSLILQGHPGVAEQLRALGEIRIATSAIVAGELMFMAERSDAREANLVLVRAFVHSIEVHGADAWTAEIYGSLKATLLDRFGPRARAQRRRYDVVTLGFTDNDLWIATTAKQHGLRLVSSNRDFLRIGPVVDIEVETWWASGAGPS